MRSNILANFALVLSLMGCEIPELEITPDEEARDWDQDGFSTDHDCDDRDPSDYPGAEEICDGYDNNCDGTVDEGFVMYTFYVDADLDGYGSDKRTMTACTAPTGYTSNTDDCDDTTDSVNPDASEVPYDDIDQDCSGEDLTDVDGDGYDSEAVDGTDCDDENPNVNYWVPEDNGNGIDDNCNGLVDAVNIYSEWYGSANGAEIAFRFQVVDDEHPMNIVLFEDSGDMRLGSFDLEAGKTLEVPANATEFEGLSEKDITFMYTSELVIRETGTKCLVWGPQAVALIEMMGAGDSCAVIDLEEW